MTVLIISAVLLTVLSGGLVQAATAQEGRPFSLSALYNKDGKAMLAVVYYGVLTRDIAVRAEIGDLTTGKPIDARQITADNTGITLGPVDIGKVCSISIKTSGIASEYHGTFSLQPAPSSEGGLLVSSDLWVGESPDGKPNSGKPFATAVGPVRIAATVQYYAYTSGSSLIGIYNSMFKAVDVTRSYGYGSYVKKDGVQVVFTRNSSTSTYYKYQFTAYYGSTTSSSEANAWINGYLYSHVIDGTGRFYGNHYVSLKGTPDSWSLEPNNGGYAYKFAYVYNGYRKESARVNLTQARLKESPSGEQQFNAYVFMASQGPYVTAELGIYCGYTRYGDWRTYRNINGVFEDLGVVVCGSTLVSGEYVPNANIDMTYSYTSGQATMTIKNLSTSTTTTIYATNANIGGNMALIAATSYAPDIGSAVTPDYRCGGYFKNVKWEQCKIYDYNNFEYPFYATSGATNYAIGYNDDCCTYTSTSTTETVSIFYNRPYQE